jgi:hypothetical protein
LLQLGDTNDSFIVVKAGLKEGEEVVLNPLALVEEAQEEVLTPRADAKSREKEPTVSGDASKQPAAPETDHVN